MLTVFAGLLILGVTVLQVIPVSILPEIPIPKISVQINQANVSVRELENTVVRPLRNQLLQVGHLKDIQSQSRNSAATISLTFDFGTNTNLAFLEVNEKIDQLLGSLPKDLSRPQVLKANATDIPVFQLSVYPKDARQQSSLELAYFTETNLKRRIEQLTEVAFVDRSGYALPEVQLIPRSALQQSLQLTEEDIKQILQDNNLELGSILVQDGQYQYNIRFLSALQSVEDLKEIYFNHHGRVFQLKDIIDIRLQKQQETGKYLFNQQSAIVFSVYKQTDAQLFALQDTFHELLQSFRTDYPALVFELSNDQSELLAVSIQSLQSSLLYGACFAFFILFLFFREWQAPLLIGLVIPLSLVVSLLGFYLLGMSINIISLSGLILGVGLMIDNSIIIIDNIRQYRMMGHPIDTACVAGASEVIRPLISSVLTTCSVFIPLIFLSGIGGALFYDQALSVSIALWISLLVAYVLLPTLIRLINHSDKAISQQDLSIHQVQNTYYSRTVDLVLRYKFLILLFFIGSTILAGWQLHKLPKESFPMLSKQAINIHIDWNNAISIQRNEEQVKNILQELEEVTTSSQSFLGVSQFLLEINKQRINESRIILYTDEELSNIKRRLQQYMQQVHPMAILEISPLKNIFDELFGAEKAKLNIHLQSATSIETPAIEAAQPLRNYLEKQGINYTQIPEEMIYEIQILQENALRSNVSYEQIYQKLQSLFNQYQISVLKTSEAYIPIRLGNTPVNLYDLVQASFIYNQEGSTIPLSNFIDIQTEKSYKTLTAGKTGEKLTIPLDTFSVTLVDDLKMAIPKENKLMLSFSGQVYEDEQNIQELSIILGIVLILLYLILAAQFESLLLPFIVMLTVPIGLSGTICLLLWTNQTLSLISIIGMIVMSGIVVNDAILKVNMMQQLRLKYPIEQAIHLAGQRRLKPIIMTSLTTILALSPILFSTGLGAELQAPLAYAVIGGLLTGTFASLYFIPIIYWLFTNKKGE